MPKLCNELNGAFCCHIMLMTSYSHQSMVTHNTLFSKFRQNLDRVNIVNMAPKRILIQFQLEYDLELVSEIW